MNNAIKDSITKRPKVTSVKIKVKPGIYGSGIDKTWIELTTDPEPNSENLKDWEITLKFPAPSEIPDSLLTDTGKYEREPIVRGSNTVTYYRRSFLHEEPKRPSVELHFEKEDVEIDIPKEVTYEEERNIK